MQEDDWDLGENVQMDGIDAMEEVDVVQLLPSMVNELV